MANLTKSQKKNRNKFIALLIAIVLVLAAILYVGYAAFMEKSAFLENQDFAAALAEVFEKDARKVSEEDLANVKFVGVYNDGETVSLSLGDEAFVTQYDAYMDEQEAIKLAAEQGLETEETVAYPAELAKTAAFEAGKDFTGLKDLGYFTGAEIIELYGMEFDEATLTKFTNVRKATFESCTISNEALAAFAGAINKEAIEEIVFSGASIDDWTPLSDISDKVTIAGYNLVPTEDGQYTIGLVEQTLTEYLEEMAKAEAEAAEKAESEAETETENTEENTEETSEETSEEVTE